MRDRQRDELFARARRAASPTDADKRRVRASLSRALGAAAATSVGASASKAAASATETALAAAVRASATTVGKVVLALLTASAVAGVAVPAFRRGESQPVRVTEAPAATSRPPAVTVRAAEAPAATSRPSTVPAAAAPPANGGVGIAKIERTGSPHEAIATPARPAPAATVAPASVVSASALAPGARGTRAVARERGLARAAHTRRAPSASDVAGELELMAKIQSGLRDGDSDGVLRLVAEHERRYPVSGWAEDREGARVLALCARSSPPEAAALGQRFLAAHGLSTLGGRVRAVCHLDASLR